MNILIDIGNSRLKWACEFQHKITLQTALLHQSFETQQANSNPDLTGFKNLSGLNWQSQLLSDWQALETPKRLVISSVARLDILQTILDLAQQLWSQVEIAIAKSQATGFGVTNSYLQPEKLGVDRWLCLIAARHFYSQAAWIVDCGTAITVDFMDADGIHAGGLIAPGLTLMKKSLLQNTAELNFNPQAYELGLANLTAAAIFSGTLYAAVGLIEQALKTQTAPAMLLLTGGDAALVAAHLQRPFQIEPDLVLKGLSVFSHSL